jgi:hypothetical protein
MLTRSVKLRELTRTTAPKRWGNLHQRNNKSVCDNMHLEK